MKSSRRARIFLIGQGTTTATAYSSLARQFDVVGLLRRTDRRDEVVDAATALGAPVFQDTSLAGVRRAVDELAPDAVVVSSYDRILPAELVAARPFVNVHYAPLPRYRGRAVVNWAIINGESHAAITVHSLEPELDSGGILFQQLVPIGPRDTVTDLYERLNGIQERALGDAVRRRLEGELGFEQNESEASYACTRLPSDGEIQWNSTTATIDRLIRALTPPFPGAYTWLGRERIIVTAAEPVLDAPPFVGRISGRVVAVHRDRGCSDVLTGDGVIRIQRVRRANGPEEPAAKVFTSLRQTAGLSVDMLMEFASPRKDQD